MRLLLDENVPRKLVHDLQEHDVKTVPEMGWSGMKNGELIRRINREKFDCFITADKNMEFQQNFRNFQFPVIVIKCKRITYPNIKAIVPDIIKLLKSGLKKGLHFVE